MFLEILVILAFVLFASLGMADAAEWLMRIFSRSKRECHIYAIIPVPDDSVDDLELRVRGVLAEACWESINADCRVLLVDTGAGAEARALCSRLAYAFDSVDFCDRRELISILSDGLQSAGNDL